MGWRDFQTSTLADKKDLKDLNTKNPEKDELNPFYPFNPQEVEAEKFSRKLDILDPGISKKSQLHLLLAPEREAFDDWYAVMVKGNANQNRESLSHEEATLLAWRFLMESMQNMYVEGRGRWKENNAAPTPEDTGSQSLFLVKPEDPKWYD